MGYDGYSVFVGFWGEVLCVFMYLLYSISGPGVVGIGFIGAGLEAQDVFITENYFFRGGEVMGID